ncbi:MAG: phage head completion protein [Rhodospirillaceae bacterium]
MSRVWAERVATWAGIAPQGWTRRNQERRLRNDVTHSVTLRRISWLDYDSHRIVWNGKTMAIRAIFDPGPRSSTMVVDCVEITA